MAEAGKFPQSFGAPEIKVAPGRFDAYLSAGRGLTDGLRSLLPRCFPKFKVPAAHRVFSRLFLGSDIPGNHISL